jgi:hypothetical protein
MHIYMKSFHVNPPTGIRAETCGQTDCHGNRRFSQIRERAEQPCSVGHVHARITAFTVYTCVQYRYSCFALAAQVEGESENARTTAEASEV